MQPVGKQKKEVTGTRPAPPWGVSGFRESRLASRSSLLFAEARLLKRLTALGFPQLQYVGMEGVSLSSRVSRVSRAFGSFSEFSPLVNKRLGNFGLRRLGVDREA